MTCEPHHFVPSPGDTYFKSLAGGPADAIDQSRTYRTVYCEGCSLTREIIAADYRPAHEVPVVVRGFEAPLVSDGKAVEVTNGRRDPDPACATKGRS